MKRAFTGVCVVIVCGILVALGFWQLHRLQWKLGLIAAIEHQQSIDTSTVDLTPALGDIGNNLHRGYLKGRFDAGKSVRIGPRLLGDQWGYWVVTPLTLADHTNVLINRGWAPDNVSEGLMSNAPKGVVQVMGVLRTPEHSAPVAGNVKHWRDVDASGIAQANGISKVAPLVMFMEGSKPKDAPDLMAAPAVMELRNEHKQYAIFWFTLAAILFAGYVAVSFRGRR